MVRYDLSKKDMEELIDLADGLGSVRAACDERGMSRDTFYRYKHLLAQLGDANQDDAVLPRDPRRLPSHVEAKILAMVAAVPRYGKRSIADALAADGDAVSHSGVYQVLKRHNLTTAAKRQVYADKQSENEQFAKATGSSHRSTGRAAVRARKASLMNPFPFDYEIPQDLRESIARETDLVHRLCREQTAGQGAYKWPPNQTKVYEDGTQRQRFLTSRLAVLRNGKLFSDVRYTARKSPGIERIVESMARVAVQCHGLRYDEHAETWAIQTSGTPVDAHRAAGWLSWHIAGERKAIQTIDLALIAHSFGLPYDIWNIPDLCTFKDIVAIEVELRARIVDKSRLCHSDHLLKFAAVDYLEQISDEAKPGALEIFDGVTGANYTTHMRAHAEVEKPDEAAFPTIPAVQELRFAVAADQEFSDGLCCLFEIDADRKITLLSRYVHDSGLDFVAGKFSYPPHDANQDLRVRLAASPKSRIVAILVTQAARKHLLECNFLTESKTKKNMVLDNDESRLRHLNRLLFTLPKQDRRIISREIVIVADQTAG